MNERCKREILCTEKDLNGPKICGTNGKTYSNPCELNRIVCFGLPVEMHRMGDCPATERCPLERDFQLKLIRSNSIKYANEFVPICDKNTKLYAQIQVSVATRVKCIGAILVSLSDRLLLVFHCSWKPYSIDICGNFYY